MRAVRVDSDYDWGWDTLAEWGGVLEREEEAIAEGLHAKQLALRRFTASAGTLFLVISVIAAFGVERIF